MNRIGCLSLFSGRTVTSSELGGKHQFHAQPGTHTRYGASFLWEPHATSCSSCQRSQPPRTSLCTEAAFRGGPLWGSQMEEP